MREITTFKDQIESSPAKYKMFPESPIKEDVNIIGGAAMD
jgi:hypothetical protein